MRRADDNQGRETADVQNRRPNQKKDMYIPSTAGLERRNEGQENGESLDKAQYAKTTAPATKCSVPSVP